MPSGAVAAIKQNVAKSTFKHPGKPATKTVRSGSATAIRGGVGPTRQDLVTLPNKLSA